MTSVPEPALVPPVVSAGAWRASDLSVARDPIQADGDSCLSALADGDASAAEAACRRWRDDAQARRTWHAYHLIGDVMRSDELAARPARDAAFLAALRSRLAHEPVVLAPVAKPAPSAASSRRPTWLTPVAAAAGLVVVTGVLVLTRSAAPDASGGVDPSASRLAIAETAAPSPPPPSPSALTVPGPLLVRDARLDDYLRAHQAAGGMAAATPGGWLRRVDNRIAQPSER